LNQIHVDSCFSPVGHKTCDEAVDVPQVLIGNFLAGPTVAVDATGSMGSLATGVGLSATTAGVSISFQILAKDAYNNLQITSSDAFMVLISGQDGSTVPVNISSTALGIYTVQYIATVAMNYNISAFFNGSRILGTLPYGTTMAVSPG
jgi:hypothetical protein